MPDLPFTLVDFVIAATFFCAVMAGIFWLRAKPNDELDKQDLESRDQRAAALLAQADNWASAAVNVVVGVLLGVAINALIQLVYRGAWFAVINVVVLFAVLSLIVFLHDYLGKKLSPGGIRPARNSEKKNKKPLVRRLSFPAGLVLGAVLASLGLDDWLLGWFS